VSAYAQVVARKTGLDDEEWVYRASVWESQR